MNVVSNNIANVNTEGYAREVFLQSSRSSTNNGLFSGSVIAQGVTSLIDPFVERQLANESSEFGTYDGRQLTMSSAEGILNDTDGQGINSAITAFFNSWSQLSGDPSNSALRQTVREAGKTLAGKFNSIHTQLQDLRSNLSTTITSRLDAVNSLTKQIADFNGQIQKTTDDTTKVELKSQRTLVVKKLSQEVGINYFEASDGALTVQLNGTGLALVSGTNSATLSATDDLNVDGKIAINSTIPGGDSNTTLDVTDFITSGRLGGNLIDRNDTLNDEISNLNELAYQFTSQINAKHQTGYGLDGVDGRNFFAPLVSKDDAAGLMAVDSGVINNLDVIAAAGDDPANTGPGDNKVALQILDLQNANTMQSGTETFGQYYTNIESKAGTTAGLVNQNYKAHSTLVNNLETQRSNVSGVNLDEEASDLLKYQRAFNGSARVMSVANQLLDTLLKI